MEKNTERKDEKNKVNNWIENVLVFVVIPLVLFLLFLCPSVSCKSSTSSKLDKSNLLRGVWVADSQAILAFTKKDYLYYNKKNNPNGKYTVKNQAVHLDKVGVPGKWSGSKLSWGGNNIYKKVLDKPILKLDKKIILGSWQTSNNRVLTFYDDGTYTFPDNSKPRKAFQLTTCGVLLDGISGIFVLTSDSTGAWCSSGGGKPLDYVKK